MHRVLLLLAALTVATGAPASGDTRRPPRPTRIVSLNLCADQYLLALADPGQIAGLTRFARDSAMSAGAEKARAMPILGGSAEEVLAVEPDLIVGMPARRSEMMGALAGRHYNMVNLPAAKSYADILDRIRTVAKAVGHPDRGEALIARMNAELAALPHPHNAGVAAYYQRRGYLTGTGTLIDDLLTRAGLTNLAGKLGKPALSQLSIEDLVAAQPDYILLESASEHVVDQGTEMLQHPALRGIKRLRLPQAWTVCGGPAYVRAARSLAAQVSVRR